MKIDFKKFTESLSIALDYAEKSVLNVEPFHGTRVAILVNEMARHLGFSVDIISSLTQAALLHDIALSEYLNDELANSDSENSERDMSAHCQVGESILKKLPFYKLVEGAVLLHHERADGKGAFGLKADKTTIYAQLIHISDSIDVNFGLYTFNQEKYINICKWIQANKGIIFTEECANVFLESISSDVLKKIAGDNCRMLLSTAIPNREIDIPIQTLKEMSLVFADITDYKSHFTWNHSRGIAEKAFTMAKYYHLSDEECDKLYIAGQLHDIGKLLIDDKILEKPGKLTSDEFKNIQNHAIGTWDMLHNIKGLEDITNWAALHHEKLDGSGYPFGYTAEKLDKNSRLMACLDIYQALVEKRPYKEGMTHQAAIAILKKMVLAGQLDEAIVNDIDLCFSHSQIKTNELSNEPAMTNLTGIAYKCPVCGFIHKGELPEDFICPRCGQPSSVFEKNCF